MPDVLCTIRLPNKHFGDIILSPCKIYSKYIRVAGKTKSLKNHGKNRRDRHPPKKTGSSAPAGKATTAIGQHRGRWNTQWLGREPEMKSL